MNGPVAVAFVLYLAAMIAIGAVAYRLVESHPDYILGGRRLGPTVAALSAGASDMSGWLLLGLPGAVYVSGLNQMWIAVGLTIGAYLNWQVLAARLRRYTELAGDSLTLPDYLENRFRDRSRLLRAASAIVILFFFTIYTSAGLVAGGILFKESFGLDYATALWIGAAVIVSYTFLGGFFAVCWTDFAQGIMMFVALLAVPIVAIDGMGGWAQTVERVARIDPSRLDGLAGMTPAAVASLLAWGLGYFGQPHILARFMAVRSPRDIPKARLIGMGWMIVSLYGAVFTGFAAVAFYADAPLGNPETAFIALSQTLFNPWIAGWLLAAILAAIMSTVSSQLLVSSSALTQDIYRAFLKRSATDRELLWLGRAGVVAIALIATLLAHDPQSTVLSLVAHAWAGFGASFGPVLILSLVWERTTRNGALAGMAAGALTVVAWSGLHRYFFDLYEILPGFAAGTLVVVAVSLLDKPPAAEIRREFAQAKG
ncbi:MAG: sodium/proline symporter PutP [Alphaproteobacteria bacterium]